MGMNHEINETAKTVGVNPIFVFIGCLTTMIASTIPTGFSFSDWVMQLFQIVGWSGTGLVGIVAALKYLFPDWRPNLKHKLKRKKK